jgi:hypothetical protein
MGEVRVFYFREYELRFNVADAPPVVEDRLEGLDPVRFEPVIVNALESSKTQSIACWRRASDERIEA